MVFMAVGEDDAEQVRLALLDEGDVGQDELDPGIGGIGEGEAEIDHHPFALGAIEIDVHADLARAAKREDEEFVAGLHFCYSGCLSFPRTRDSTGTFGRGGTADWIPAFAGMTGRSNPGSVRRAGRGPRTSKDRKLTCLNSNQPCAYTK